MMKTTVDIKSKQTPESFMKLLDRYIDARIKASRTMANPTNKLKRKTAVLNVRKQMINFLEGKDNEQVN